LPDVRFRRRHRICRQQIIWHFSVLRAASAYPIGIAISELIRRFWLRFSFAQICAGEATAKT
jgi:hypothetical protein